MTDPLTAVSTRRTPQTQPAKAGQVKNNAGGFTFALDDRTRLRRFLTLGSEGNTYYAGESELTQENAAVVLRMAENDHEHLVAAIVDISQSGRAPKANYCLFALAVAASIGTPGERRYALDYLPVVARTGTHLFIFTKYVEQFRGWGRQLRNAISTWYTVSDVDDLAYQTVKYRSREGWTHRDLLRKAHPRVQSEDRRALFDWITHGTTGERTPALVEGFIKANRDDVTSEAVARIVRDYRLSWEMLPDYHLASTEVWDALLDNGVPATALMRQLPRLTRLGMLPQMGGRTAEIAARLCDAERLKKARVHPINVLVAQRTYASGQSARGTGTWQPTRQIVDALDAAFYAAFGAVEPANKRTMLGLDVSGSMGYERISNMPITPREASAALALVQAATEPEHAIFGFTCASRRGFGQVRDTQLTPLDISPRQRLDDVIRRVSGLPFGATDCSLPMLGALELGVAVDTFVIYTDNETYAGRMHPHQALQLYREQTGIPAKLVVVGMTATGFSIADPNDQGMLDVAGFDSAVPSLISDFSRSL